MYKYTDDIVEAESEFEDYSYSYLVSDKDGEVIALCCTEEAADRIVNALNAALNPHEKE